MLYRMYNMEKAKQMNEMPSKLDADGYLLQIKKIGNSVGLILPKELLPRLKLKEGDNL